MTTNHDQQVFSLQKQEVGNIRDSNNVFPRRLNFHTCLVLRNFVIFEYISHRIFPSLQIKDIILVYEVIAIDTR